MVILARLAVRAWWLLVPHPFVSSGQFSSGICRRCKRQHMRTWF